MKPTLTPGQKPKDAPEGLPLGLLCLDLEGSITGRPYEPVSLDIDHDPVTQEVIFEFTYADATGYEGEAAYGSLIIPDSVLDRLITEHVARRLAALTAAPEARRN